MPGHRKASEIILDLTDAARRLVGTRHLIGMEWDGRIEGLRAEMLAAGAHDPSGRGQFLTGAADILARCTLQVLEMRRNAADPTVAIEWEKATLPFIAFAQDEAHRALKYEIAEGVL